MSIPVRYGTRKITEKHAYAIEDDAWIIQISIPCGNTSSDHLCLLVKPLAAKCREIVKEEYVAFKQDHPVAGKHECKTCLTRVSEGCV